MWVCEVKILLSWVASRRIQPTHADFLFTGLKQGLCRAGAPLENHGIGAGFPVGWDGTHTMKVLLGARSGPQDPAPGKGDPLQCQGVDPSSIRKL